MDTKLRELKTRLLEVNDLSSAAAVLHWDQTTYMPPGGAPARGRQLATLERLAHEKFTDPVIGRLLDALRPHEQNLAFEHDDAALIRVTRREYERAVKVPPAFMAELHEHFAASYAAWTVARPANDFAAVRPHLEKTLDLSRRLAEFFPGYRHIADPLIDDADFGMTADSVRSVFSDLRAHLVPLVRAIGDRPPVDDSCLRRDYPEVEQGAFAEQVIRRLGYDFERGRLDRTAHPFMIRFAAGDVRITTRSRQDFLGEQLFSTIHEAGHALYEQGVAPEFDGTPLGGGTSAGVHESQSRLWENLVARSRDFWMGFYPQLQAKFSAQLADVPLEVFYRAINAVRPSLIRTDADEVTYNLHVMLRFELELELLEGRLAIADLPDAWHVRYAADLGLRAADDREGVLQDVHWFAGTIGGAFQGYTLGNIISAQVFEVALAAHPEIPQQIRTGQFETLHTWLREHIYRHGGKFTTNELLQRVAGGPLSVEPLAHHLRTKYGDLYDL